MILIISTCKEKLHELEFVKPVEEIVSRGFITKHYSEISEEDLNEAEKVIICGTSLMDNQFIDDLGNFEWLKEFERPVLGICAGFQIIGLVFGGSVGEKQEIGYYKENFIKDFFGLEGEQEVYHLHNNYVSFGDDFDEFTDSEISQAVKHKEKEIYGCLFHPEVRNKELISRFVGQ
jgi:GMP synthase-like glutamine amidotransferase